MLAGRAIWGAPSEKGLALTRDFAEARPEFTERLMRAVWRACLLGLIAAAGMAARRAEVMVIHLMGHLMERQLDPAAGYLRVFFIT